MEVPKPLETIRKLKRNSYLLAMYAAVIAEVRRAMDDWVPVCNFTQYKDLLHSLGLAVLEDCIFKQLNPGESISGIESSPTTRARGLSMARASDAGPNATVHVFVSKRKEWAEAALHAGWYPIAIPGDRLLLKPRADARRLGRAFGYPDCCTEAFMAHNEWSTRSHLSEAFKRSQYLDWRANCLAMRTRLTPMCHIPCRYDCRETISLTEAVLEAVNQFDRNFARQIKQYLRGTFLVLNEATVFRLRNARTASPPFVQFSCAEDVYHTRIEMNDQSSQISSLLASANSVGIEDGIIVIISKEKRTWFEPSIHAKWFEDPFIAIFD